MKTELENYLSHLIDNDVNVKKAMNYSLLAEGKRVRPLLLLNLLKDFNTEISKGFPAANMWDWHSLNGFSRIWKRFALCGTH